MQKILCIPLSKSSKNSLKYPVAPRSFRFCFFNKTCKTRSVVIINKFIASKLQKKKIYIIYQHNNCNNDIRPQLYLLEKQEEEISRRLLHVRQDKFHPPYWNYGQHLGIYFMYELWKYGCVSIVKIVEDGFFLSFFLFFIEMKCF